MTSRDFLTIDDFDTDGKTILVRVDLNSPMDPQGNILDDMRIRSHVATLKDLEDSKVVLVAHQSRPGKKDFTTMKPHANLMSKYLGKQVLYVDDIFGTYARTQISSMENGDVILLENVRFYSEESLERTPLEQSKTYPIKKLSPFVDIFLNDAFAVSHRSQLSVVGFTPVLPSGAGRVMEKELLSLDRGMKGAARPCIFVLGGAKVDDSLRVAENVLKSGAADRVLLTGVVANAALAASGANIGKVNLDFIKSQGYEDQIDKARELLAKFEDKVGLPIDVALNDNKKRVEVRVSDLNSESLPINDIGIETIVDYSKEIENAKTVVLNGPAGVFEIAEFALGTTEIIKAATKSEFSIAGGGHITAEVERLGLPHRFSHISTGGGAMIDYLSGMKLPGVEALKSSAKMYLEAKKI
jgi:phosphoglycerate kinase